MCLKHLGKLTKYDYYIIKSKDSILIIRRGGTFLPTPGHIRVKPSCTLNQKFMATESQLGKTHSYISSNITIHITFTFKYSFNFFIQSTSITIPNIAEAILNKFVFQPLLKSSKKHFFIHH